MSSVIIEQTNPLAPGTSATYHIKKGNASFNDFILSYPRGAYTGMRTVGHGAILELDSHMKRVVNSLSLMKLCAPEQSMESDTVQEQMASFRNMISLEEKLIPLLRTGLKTYYDQEPTAVEAKVSLMITYSYDLQQPCFAAHFGHIGQIIPHQRIKVELENKARTMPAVKDSQWVRDRASLEKNKPQDINEVVLVDDMDRIYEGMASNFFAVRQRQDMENNELKSRYVIQTASLEHVLLGTLMKVVMALCEQEKIDIEWVFPKLQDARAGKWEGCFLTSTSRLLLPIERIYCKDGRTIEFPPSEFLNELQDKVLMAVKDRSYTIL